MAPSPFSPGAADIGQGSNTMVAQVVAEVLGVDLNRLRVISADSALTPKDNGTYSSRVTFMVGNAAVDAANELKVILIEAAAKQLDAQPEKSNARAKSFGSRARTRACRSPRWSRRRWSDAGPITVKGTFTSPPEFMGDKAVRGSAIGATMGFCYAAQVVECSVDEVTGKVTAHKVWVAVDVGRALNPLAVEGQIQGGVWMGMGQAMSEETRFDQGRMMHANLLDYRVPTMAESPDIEVFIVESIDPNGPFGAKEASEGMLAGFLPAVMDAVYEAAGIRPGRPAADSRPHRRAAGRQERVRVMNLMPDFRCHRPATLEEAVRLKAASAGTRFLAGGTDLLVNLRRGLGEPSDLIDLDRRRRSSRHPPRRRFAVAGRGGDAGRLARHPEVLAAYPALAEAALAVAGPTHRVGGNAWRQPVPGHPLHLL